MSYAAKCLLVFPFALVLAVLWFNVNDFPLVSSSYFYTRVCFILLGFWQSLLDYLEWRDISNLIFDHFLLTFVSFILFAIYICVSIDYFTHLLTMFCLSLLPFAPEVSCCISIICIYVHLSNKISILEYVRLL
jgi:hypothetical protein